MRLILLLYRSLSTPVSASGFFVSATPDAVPTGRDVGGLNWVRVFPNEADGDGG